MATDVIEDKQQLHTMVDLLAPEELAGFGLTVNDFRKMGQTPMPPESSGNG
jgi:hypothetical protein